MQLDSLWTWPVFTSTSSDEDAIKGFGEYIFHIDGTSGRDISEFSPYPHEKEVVFVPGTCVRVVEVNDSYCVLEERTSCVISNYFVH